MKRLTKNYDFGRCNLSRETFTRFYLWQVRSWYHAWLSASASYWVKFMATHNFYIAMFKLLLPIAPAYIARFQSISAPTRCCQSNRRNSTTLRKTENARSRTNRGKDLVIHAKLYVVFVVFFSAKSVAMDIKCLGAFVTVDCGGDGQKFFLGID